MRDCTGFPARLGAVLSFPTGLLSVTLSSVRLRIASLSALCLVLCLCGCTPRQTVSCGPSLPGQAARMRDDAPLLSADGTALPAWRVLYWLTLTCDRIREEHQALGTVPDWSAPVDGAGHTGSTVGTGNGTDGGGSSGGTDSGSGSVGADGGTGTADGGGGGVGGKTLSDYAKEQAVADALLYVQTEALAARYGVTLDEADGAALEEQWAERCASHGGEAAYLQLLARFGLDKGRSMELYRTGRLYGKLCTLVREGGGPQPDDAQYDALVRESREIRFDRILATGDGARTKASAYFVRLNGAADQETLFSELAAQGDDRAGPRVLTEDLDDRLAASLRALEIGQLSGIVESAEGYSILRRLPPERGPLLDAFLDGTLEQAAASAQVRVSEFRD